MLNAKDFQNLDSKNFGNWPIPVKAVIIMILCLAALGAGYWFDTQYQLISLAGIQEEEEKLRKDFKDKQWKAATLPKLKEQLAEIEATIKEQKNRLPSEAEVAELITEISQQMIASGLEQELFKPNYTNKKQEKNVYETLPIEIYVKGDYHSFGKFVSGVAAMPRIVTQHDISITAPLFSGGGAPNAKVDRRLTMKMISQIYRYLEEKPPEPEQANQPKDAAAAPLKTEPKK